MDILATLGEITVYSAIIFAILMLFKKVFNKKLSPLMHYVLWGLLIARLVVPITLDSQIKFITIPQKEVASQNLNFYGDDDEATPQAQRANTQMPPTNGNVQLHTNLNGNINGMATGNTTGSNTLGQNSYTKGVQTFTIYDVLLIIWLFGIGAVGVYMLFSYMYLRQKLKESTLLPTKELYMLFLECKKALGIKAKIKLRCQYGINSPALLFPRTILMPLCLLKNTSEEQIKLMLTHELYHYKYKDHFVILMLALLRAVYWFNPVVWISFYKIVNDMENLCDSRVIKQVGEKNRRLYADTLLLLFSMNKKGLVLGMANTRKNAKNRIKGVYLRGKSAKGTKIEAVILSMIIGVMCFTTACVPTPQKEVVVNKAEGKMQEELSKPVQETVPTQEVKVEENPYAPVKYNVSEHWKEDMVRDNGRLTINADIDVLMPDVDAYPVQTIEQKQINQQEANEFIDYFVGENPKFYTVYLPKTKSDYEQEIINLKTSLAEVEAGGDGEDPDSIRGYIAEKEKKLETAPATATPQEIEPVFTYRRNFETGEPEKEYGEHYIEVAIRDNSNLKKDIYIEDGKEGGISTLSYNDIGTFERESSIKQQLVYCEAQFERINKNMIANPNSHADYNAMLKEEQESYDKFKDLLEIFNENPMDIAQIEQKAIMILKELNITNVQVENVERALLDFCDINEVYKRREFVEPTEHGVYISFIRQNGGVLNKYLTSGGFNSQISYEGMYSPPFFPENVSMVFDVEGNLRRFNNSFVTKEIQTDAKNSEILPFEEIKERLAAHILHTENYGIEKNLRYKPVEVKLAMSYINVKDENKQAIAVPAWYFKMEEYVTITDNNYTFTIEEEKGAELKEYLFNAIDGSAILLPGNKI